MTLNYIFASEIGLKRNENEDFVNVIKLEDGLLAVVCDGLGGNNGGSVASKTAVTQINSFFQENKNMNINKKIPEAIKAANKELIKLSKSNPELKGMATTAVILFINEKKAYWGHVGDSRIYFFQDNKLTQVTTDHSFVQKLLDEGYITPTEAHRHPHKNIIMRALGDKEIIEIDQDIILLDNSRPWKFILCSDGVSGVVERQELEDILRNYELQTISDTLNSLILERGAPDNFSYIIISYER